MVIDSLDKMNAESALRLFFFFFLWLCLLFVSQKRKR